jgi:hypothetical protein
MSAPKSGGDAGKSGADNNDSSVPPVHAQDDDDIDDDNKPSVCLMNEPPEGESFGRQTLTEGEVCAVCHNALSILAEEEYCVMFLIGSRPFLAACSHLCK